MQRRAKTISNRIRNPSDIPYLNAIILHAVIGFLIFSFKFLSLIYMLGIMTYFIIKIISKPQDPVVVLEGAAYIMATEVFLRMTEGYIFYETGKYAVILFMLFGLFFHGFKTKALIYVLYLLLLLPAVFITFIEIPYDMDFRKNILFNLSGPLSLAISALFCYDLKINYRRFLTLLDYMLLPIIAMTVYLLFYSPDLREVVTNADASSGAAGGFGPNQVSTILGIGIFVTLVRMFIPYKNHLLQLINFALFPLLIFRALATLSRGGVITALLMIVAFLLIYFIYSNTKKRAIGLFKLTLILILGIIVWSGAIVATEGMVFNKYTNRNASGDKQNESSIYTGRGELAKAELKTFAKNPFFGVGVGLGKIERLKRTGKEAATHSELTRVIGEHGLLGIITILILLIVPSIKFLKNTRNLFLIPLIIFWGATINHSAMRIAAPGFVYGLALLNIQYPRIRRRARQQLKTYQRKYHGLQAALSR